MPLEIIRNDITKMQVDAIINSTDPYYKALGGADYSIHKAAGPELDLYCSQLKACGTGEAVITPGFDLPCRYIIHTVAESSGPSADVQDSLKQCYHACLKCAKENGCESVAFPLIGSGTFRYPKHKALQIAMDTIRDFLFENEMDVYIVVYDKKAFSVSTKLLADVKAYIDDVYVDENRKKYPFGRRISGRIKAGYPELDISKSIRYSKAYEDGNSCEAVRSYSPKNVDGYMLDESFSEMLLRLIDESGMKDSECYNRANVSRQVFSKIRSSKDYIPNKTTILALAIALELDIDTTRELLEKAGYSLSHSRLLDVIVESFIVKGKYNIYEINSVLYKYDQLQLGAKC